ncbi:MAG: hypothetical protein WBN82_03440 [Porticoccaceae bacterium]
MRRQDCSTQRFHAPEQAPEHGVHGRHRLGHHGVDCDEFVQFFIRGQTR